MRTMSIKFLIVLLVNFIISYKKETSVG